MVLRYLLITTGFISFLYFLFPASFEKINPKDKDVLGVTKINATINKPTINTALFAYCINKGVLPKKLDDLYDGYLMDDRKLDLDNLFYYSVIQDSKCTYELKVIKG